MGWLPQDEPRRMFMAGGSDAHGDFNYRREGYMTGPTRVTDDALAKVRNLVEVGVPRGPCSAIDGKCHGLDPAVPGHSQDQVVEALAEGRSSVTDGPALRIVVDRNRNHVIDAADTPMGGVIDLFPGEPLPLLIQAESTAEFGTLASMDLYVGVDHDAEAVCGEPGCATSTGEQRARTYAPENHGVRGTWRENVDNLEIPDLSAQNCGSGVCEMADHYWEPAAGARGMLRADATSLANGLWEVPLDPDQFPVNSTRDPRPTRLYVRAFARTTPGVRCLSEFPAGHFHQECADRFAYTNPIWALRQPSIVGDCPLTNRALDRDGDGLPADAQLTAQGDDAVIVKFNRAGQFMKKNVFQGAGTQVITDITIVGDVIHVSGTRKAQTVIDGVQTMSQSTDPFVARINPADLRAEWIRYIDGTGDATARAVAANANGQVVVVGDFSGQLAAFQPGVFAEGASDCFIAFYKLSPPTTPPTPPTPQLQSLTPIAGNGTCQARDVAIDAGGRATAVYDFTSTVKPSLSIVRTTRGTDSIVVRYGTLAESFTPAWATTIGSASAGEFDRGDASTNAIAVSLDGTVFVAGSFDGWLAVNDSLRRPSSGGRDGFIVHLAATGLILPSPMLSVAGTAGNDTVTSLDVDGSGRLLIAGTFESTSVNLNALSLTRQGAIRNAFVAWVDATGTASSVHQYNDLVTFSRAVVSFDGRHAALASSFMNDARYDASRVVHTAGSLDGAVTLIPESL